ncbi:hypothetical protein CC80DRAFT_404609 [Byssothecium circinans]|uniref:Tcp11-domain-containing protein n=1 Tax=Byssothecium circinans TaxID=147558 RepID=A0A6A5UGS3_9PLEO|nr:hypothetical protein CC80DRAFT_404609 [Byssothecium circinans]
MTGVIDAAGSTWQSTVVSSGCANREECGQRHSKRWGPERDGCSRTPCSTRTTETERAIPDQLAELLMDMIPGMEGADLGEAFQCAAEQPPVTKQSLGELDIQNIITNIKLRHDVNFDKDLSFRPNLDGPKGQEKRRYSDKYWRALVAEMELYVRLFQGTPSMCSMEQGKWAEFTKHAQRRIPKMFETIHEVLKSLVPDRDHARVDEHFDEKMLMQEIERGVCDLVKRAEWVASLLKEHCAPMRDVYVDSMVRKIRAGVASNSSSLVISGLRELLGILEAMKLDVANHQIRNLKTLLIEDTVNFERHYHLDRLVNKRSKVNVDAAQKWWALAIRQSQHRSDSTRDVFRLQLETFTQAVVAHLFTQDGLARLPDTFYLDQERLRVLKSEVDDLIHFESCFDLFAQCLKEFGYPGPVTTTAENQLRAALSAIIGEGIGHTPQSWIHHSEALSLEIYRQALLLSNRPFTYDHYKLQQANQFLQRNFQCYSSTYSSKTRDVVLPQVLACMNKYYNASPIELFNKLIVLLPTSTPLDQAVAPTQPPHTFSSSSDRVNDLAHRITHIVLLHWRVWGPIAYVQEDSSAPNTSQLPPQSQAPAPSPFSAAEQTPAPHIHASYPPLASGEDTEISELADTEVAGGVRNTELP